MYQVRRNNRVILKGATFKTYEKARQALRKFIRAAVSKGKYDQNMFNGNQPWDVVSRNPVNYTAAGFQIRKAA